ncbi:MAG: hypothetical protein HY308_16525 [Gammaproteobacteria bacterium]|nr:hypothetical protein [Gammaproteobacteria bacterium]
MKLRRAVHRFSLWGTFLALLFTQLAMASYACPNITPTTVSPDAGMMADCGNLPDKGQPNLCKAHHDTRAQLNDQQSPLPPLASFAMVAIYLLPSLIDVSNEANAHLDSYRLTRLEPDGSPPLFLQVLRI